MSYRLADIKDRRETKPHRRHGMRDGSSYLWHYRNYRKQRDQFRELGYSFNGYLEMCGRMSFLQMIFLAGLILYLCCMAGILLFGLLAAREFASC